MVKLQKRSLSELGSRVSRPVIGYEGDVALEVLVDLARLLVERLQVFHVKSHCHGRGYPILASEPPDKYFV